MEMLEQMPEIEHALVFGLPHPTLEEEVDVEGALLQILKPPCELDLVLLTIGANDIRLRRPAATSPATARST